MEERLAKLILAAKHQMDRLAYRQTGRRAKEDE